MDETSAARDGVKAWAANTLANSLYARLPLADFFRQLAEVDGHYFLDGGSAEAALRLARRHGPEEPPAAAETIPAVLRMSDNGLAAYLAKQGGMISLGWAWGGNPEGDLIGLAAARLLEGTEWAPTDTPNSPSPDETLR